MSLQWSVDEANSTSQSPQRRVVENRDLLPPQRYPAVALKTAQQPCHHLAHCAMFRGQSCKTYHLVLHLAVALNELNRAFQTARFSKDAKKAKIKDVELCLAIQQILLGQVDDLGGGVFKKRLNNNLHRSIILAKGGKYWIYEYLFAKKDRDNIENDELLAFRLLAKSYAGLTEHQVAQLLVNKHFVEICHDDKTKI